MTETLPLSNTIAVIGAGLAGLSCANALREAGCAVTVFDKSRGPSGRLSTKRGSDNLGSEWQCDQGAPWFTAIDPSFRAVVAEWMANGHAAIWRPMVNGPDDTMPVRHVGLPRMTALGRHLSHDLKLTLQTTICNLRRDTAGWSLASSEQGWLPGHYAAIVLAVPAPQAVPLLRPVAAALADAVAEVRMSACWSVILRFSAPTDRTADLILPTRHGLLQHAVRDSSKPGREGPETWLLQATADWSDAHVEADPGFVADALLDAFLAPADPPPHAWSSHRWRYASTRHTPFDGPIWQRADAIGVCGDWLSAAGTVESAWLSGRELARQLLADLPGGHDTAPRQGRTG